MPNKAKIVLAFNPTFIAQTVERINKGLKNHPEYTDGLPYAMVETDSDVFRLHAENVKQAFYKGERVQRFVIHGLFWHAFHACAIQGISAEKISDALNSNSPKLYRYADPAELLKRAKEDRLQSNGEFKAWLNALKFTVATLKHIDGLDTNDLADYVKQKAKTLYPIHKEK